MKKYLLGLGAMLIGAGLMFVFTHTEVSADDKKKSHCEHISFEQLGHTVLYCKVKNLTCVINPNGTSCVKS